MKPLASVSLDLDNQWSYLKTFGNPAWQQYPSYYDVFVPYALEVLDQLQLRITFFLVGQDLAIDANHQAARLLARSAHEIGNHSFHHEPWLHLYSKDQIREELERTEQVIADVMGRTPDGFRGPGFSWSSPLLDVLAERGYRYDASLLPTYIGPLARMYFMRTSSLSREEKARRSKLYGSFRDGRRPLGAHLLETPAGRRVLEIPITTVPIVRLPFHLSYLLYISRISSSLMMAYLRTALAACRATRTEVSFLLHPLDLLGGDQAPSLAFFPGMDLTAARKRVVFDRVIRELQRHFTLVPMGVHAQALAARPDLRRVRVTEGS